MLSILSSDYFDIVNAINIINHYIEEINEPCHTYTILAIQPFLVIK